MTIVGFWSLYHDVVTIVCKNSFMALVVMTTNKNSLKRHYFEHSRCYYSRYNYWKLHHLRLRLRCATTSTPSRSEWRQLEDPQRDLSLSKSTKRRLYLSSSKFANRKCSSMISVVLKHLDLKFRKSTKLWMKMTSWKGSFSGHSDSPHLNCSSPTFVNYNEWIMFHFLFLFIKKNVVCLQI